MSNHSYTDLSWNETPERVFSTWEKLVQERALNPSLLPEWIECVAKSHNLLSDIRVFHNCNDSQPHGIFPYLIRKRKINGLPLRCLESASNLVSYHPDLICSTTCNDLMEKLFQHTEGKWDIAYIHNVSPESLAAAQIISYARGGDNVLLQYPAESSPYVVLEGTWDDFISAKRSKFRNNLKRRMRKMNKAGHVEIRWHEDKDDTSSLLQSIMTIEEESWKVSADMSVAHRPVESDYYERLIPFLANSGRLFSNILYLDNTPVAYSLCYKDKHKIGQLKTSYSSKFKQLYPGSIINEDAVKRAFETNAQEFDFLGDIMPHKMEWADQIREHSNYFLFSKKLPIHIFGKIKQTIENFRERWTARASEVKQ